MLNFLIQFAKIATVIFPLIELFARTFRSKAVLAENQTPGCFNVHLLALRERYPQLKLNYTYKYGRETLEQVDITSDVACLLTIQYEPPTSYQFNITWKPKYQHLDSAIPSGVSHGDLAHVVSLAEAVCYLMKINS